MRKIDLIFANKEAYTQSADYGGESGTSYFLVLFQVKK